MFERPSGGTRTVLVMLHFDGDEDAHPGEFEDLATSAGLDCVATLHAKRHAPDPRFLVGSGKAEEIRALAVAYDAELVIFDRPLSPSQERNLEKVLQCRVTDRTGLILDIFAQRARSFEGKLQVELAQLRHSATRLVRGWTHLERQRGGIGLRGGPGETQLEADRRLLAERIRQVEQRLEKVDRQRAQGRQARHKIPLPTVSLVGYTNAGKSTLFNALTCAEVYVADQLFATLDPTLRRLTLPHSGAVILADTVGFIHQLPHELVAAFRATLQETCEARLLLHVIDASHPVHEAVIAQVEAVLTEIGAATVPMLRVFNKIDRIDDGAARTEKDGRGDIQAVWVSAITGAGLDQLVIAIAERLSGHRTQRVVQLQPTEGRLRATLFAAGVVVEETIDAQGCAHITVCATAEQWAALERQGI